MVCRPNGIPTLCVNRVLMHRNTSNILFDYLVGNYNERIGHREAECLRGPKIDDETVGRWLLKWQIARFLAAQNAIYVGSGLAKHYEYIWTVGDQPSGCCEHRKREDCRHAVACQ